MLELIYYRVFATISTYLDSFFYVFYSRPFYFKLAKPLPLFYVSSFANDKNKLENNFYLSLIPF